MEASCVFIYCLKVLTTFQSTVYEFPTFVPSLAPQSFRSIITMVPANVLHAENPIHETNCI